MEKGSVVDAQIELRYQEALELERCRDIDYFAKTYINTDFYLRELDEQYEALMTRYYARIRSGGIRREGRGILDAISVGLGGA